MVMAYRMRCLIALRQGKIEKIRYDKLDSILYDEGCLPPSLVLWLQK